MPQLLVFMLYPFTSSWREREKLLGQWTSSSWCQTNESKFAAANKAEKTERRWRVFVLDPQTHAWFSSLWCQKKEQQRNEPSLLDILPHLSEGWSYKELPIVMWGISVSEPQVTKPSYTLKAFWKYGKCLDKSFMQRYCRHKKVKIASFFFPSLHLFYLSHHLLNWEVDEGRYQISWLVLWLSEEGDNLENTSDIDCKKNSLSLQKLALKMHEQLCL